MQQKGTLVFFCGKMGSGKSTKAQMVASEMNAILLSEDEWLADLYPDEINNLDDYIKYSLRIRNLLKNHLQNVLNSGISVIMDFPANTVNQRKWFKEIYSEHGIPHKLIYIEASDQLCLKQIQQRKITHPEREKFDTEEVFHQVTGYFQPPAEVEGFNIEIIRR